MGVVTDLQPDSVQTSDDSLRATLNDFENAGFNVSRLL